MLEEILEGVDPRVPDQVEVPPLVVRNPVLAVEEAAKEVRRLAQILVEKFLRRREVVRNRFRKIERDAGKHVVRSSVHLSFFEMLVGVEVVVTLLTRDAPRGDQLAALKAGHLVEKDDLVAGEVD